MFFEIQEFHQWYSLCVTLHTCNRPQATDDNLWSDERDTTILGYSSPREVGFPTLSISV